MILGLFTLCALLISGRYIHSAVCKTLEHGTVGLPVGRLILATSGFSVVGTARQVHHEQALSYPGPAVACLGPIVWLVGSGRRIGSGRVSNGKSGTYRLAWLATPAGLVKNPVKSMAWRKWWVGAMTYLGEHSLSVGIMTQPIYGTM